MYLISFALPNFASSEVWMSLLTLTFLEIVLGVDNIIFITIAASKLPEKQRRKATNIGLLLAMVLRIVLLLGISVLIAMNAPWIKINLSWMHAEFTGQSLILIAGGIFLLYKSVAEIHGKLEGDHEHGLHGKIGSLSKAILQITMINLIFSFDSILTAVGMTNGIGGALIIMIIAVVTSVLIMMLFANPVGSFVNKHPTLQMLGLSFLILIGFMLILEGGHLAHLTIAGQEIGSIPKGYLYFAITFSLFVEFLNIRLRKKTKPIQLRDVKGKAKEEGII
jgi:predicted tellurium resistance membrane protein TerC